jgi:N-acetylglucosaminyl-diphospho-decaprenol L-rhamnosyltransferase
MRDLAVIIVSYNSAPWLVPCLSSLYAHAGDVRLGVIVVDNGSTDDSVELVEREFPQVRTVRAENRGFSAGNNAGLQFVTAPHVLFLNPDTEILDGTFGELLDLMEARPSVGLIGCRQVAADGSLHPTIRRFPSAARYLFASLGSERLPFDASWLGERVRKQSVYDREIRCDWTSGSFMLARTDAVLAAGAFDERYFLYSEEPDLCLRLHRRGWEVRHVPVMTILHHAGKAGLNERLVAQDAYSRQQYLEKNLSPTRRRLALLGYAIGHVLRSGYLTTDAELRGSRRACASRALRTLRGTVPPPFEGLTTSRAASAS